ncbi:hypothetical protein Cva_01650 [Caedimonas varicaedens]|uniref:Uncharacterized protein n=1 Tax=Caedimonas varicaedens TaxID=1629334 RepID=A0A0K8MEP2_9PROT|nr:hypothetical protein Cva_01650 [Caedimonas varicaedens]
MRRNSCLPFNLSMSSVTRRKLKKLIFIFKSLFFEFLVSFLRIPPFFNSFLLQIAQVGVFMVPSPLGLLLGKPKGEGTITPPSGCECKTSKEGLRNNYTPDEETPR